MGLGAPRKIRIRCVSGVPPGHMTVGVLIYVQQLQGTLLVTLRNSVSGQPIDDNEVRRKFQQFGDVRSVRPVGDRAE